MPSPFGVWRNRQTQQTWGLLSNFNSRAVLVNLTKNLLSESSCQFESGYPDHYCGFSVAVA